MKLFLRYEVQAQEARKTKDRRRSGDRRRARLQVEPLEGRQLLSWGSVSPAHITPPVNSPPSTHVYPQAPSDPGTAIELKALALGSSFTGTPISGLETVPGGYRIQYQNCDIYDSLITGAHEVHGAIRAEYAALAQETDSSGRDAQLVLGLPTSDEMNVPGVSGARMNTFQDGAIYWSPSTGAHVVYGAIGAEYAALAQETDAYGNDAQLVLGLPTSDEMNVPGVSGARMNTFQDGAIYWSPSTGAHVVYGAIGAEYAALAHETDAYGRDAQLVVGLPTSDEMNVPGVSGARMNTFQYGVIYWSPSTGAHVVYGAIGGLYYNSLGGPTSFLGLPISDELGIPGGRVSYFQHGEILWTPQGGAYAV